MLNNRQKQHLKALAHAKKPVVIVGGNGLTPAVLHELEAALSHHELVKVRVNAQDRDARLEIIDIVRNTLGAELIQQLGHVATFYRRNPQAPRISLS